MARDTAAEADRVREQDMAEVYEYYRRWAEQNRGEVAAIVARLRGNGDDSAASP